MQDNHYMVNYSLSYATSAMLCLLCLLGVVTTAAYSQQKTFSLYLIGDAGLTSVSTNGMPESLRNHFDPEVPSSFVLLGDNIYPKGMPPTGSRGREGAEAILHAQVNLLREFNSPIFIIPGNHDWKKGKKEGWQYILNQQVFVDSLKNSDIHFLPGGGCPGPVEIQANPNLVLIVFDSQWFLHRWDKPANDKSHCAVKNPQDAMIMLQNTLALNKHNRVVVLAHHPIVTYGPHGGVFTFSDHLFPLTSVNKSLYIPIPVLGSLYPLYRKFIGNIQDTAHPVYELYSSQMTKVLERYPGSVYASGHEHALEYSLRNNVHYIVSGSGSKSTPVRLKGYAQHVSQAKGFVRLDLFDDGSSSIVFFETGKRDPRWSANLPHVTR